MGYDIRIEEKLFFVWDSALFIGGYEFGCSAERKEADDLLRLIEVDDAPAEEEVAEAVRTQDGTTRFCYVLRLPRPLTPFTRRHPIATIDDFARAMREEDDVEVTFGYVSALNYLQLLGKIAKYRVPKGQSCFILKAPTNHIVLSANHPPMLIRVSSLPNEDTPRPAA